MDDTSITIGSYNKSADWNSRKSDGYDWSNQIAKFCSLLKGKKILDMGCGNGRDSVIFSSKGFDVYAIDFSDALIEIARTRLPAAKLLKANFLEKLPFSDCEFDGIWSCASLLHVPKKKIASVLAEMNRVTKKSGAIFISVKKGEGERLVKDDFGDCERFFSFFSAQELSAELEKAGFKVVELSEIPDSAIRVNFEKKKSPQDWIVFYCIKN